MMKWKRFRGSCSDHQTLDHNKTPYAKLAQDFDLQRLIHDRTPPTRTIAALAAAPPASAAAISSTLANMLTLSWFLRL